MSRKERNQMTVMAGVQRQGGEQRRAGENQEQRKDDGILGCVHGLLIPDHATAMAYGELAGVNFSRARAGSGRVTPGSEESLSDD